jgi:hypothetical protein
MLIGAVACNSTSGGGSGPEWLPDGAIDYADFENGNYYTDGAEAALADLFSPNASFGSFTPANVVADQGLIGTASDDSVLIFDRVIGDRVIASGTTAVIDFTMAAFTALTFEVADENFGTEFVINLARAAPGFIQPGYAADSDAIAAMTAAAHKVAVTYLPNGDMAYSIDGAAFVTAASAETPDVTDVLFFINQSGVVRSITLYAPVANAALPGLSTL